MLTRLFSTNVEQYPLGDADRVEDTAWFRQLFGRGEPIIANDGPEIDRWLPGFDAYFAEQGYGALANVPVIVAGRPVGLVNMMGQAGHFSPERLAALRPHLPLAALAILAAAWTPR
ncbi:MAG: GAF domain-containing protein [Nitratireductor sp.]